MNLFYAQVERSNLERYDRVELLKILVKGSRVWVIKYSIRMLTAFDSNSGKILTRIRHNARRPCLQSKVIDYSRSRPRTVETSGMLPLFRFWSSLNPHCHAHPFLYARCYSLSLSLLLLYSLTVLSVASSFLSVSLCSAVSLSLSSRLCPSLFLFLARSARS